MIKIKRENKKKKILIISDSFENEKKSVSKLMTDLFIEFDYRGYSIDIITSTSELDLNNIIKKKSSTFYCLNKKFSEKNYYFRGLNELYFGFKIASILNNKNYIYQSTIWYSPSIFIGLGLYLCLKRKKLGRKIMILRDLFPEWAFDLGVFKKYSISYFFLKFLSKFQYKISDFIYVQSEYDKLFIKNKRNFKNVDILYSWYDFDNFKFKITNFFYEFNQKKYVLILGNIDIAQNLTKMLEIIKNLAISQKNVNFVSFGLEKNAFQKFTDVKLKYKLDNLFLYPKIEQKYIPHLCVNAQCGIYSLNDKFISNNIPGRFVMYSLCGLKSFGFFKNNHELENIISKFKFGSYSDFNRTNLNKTFFDFLWDNSYSKSNIKKNSSLFFSVKTAVDKITDIF